MGRWWSDAIMLVVQVIISSVALSCVVSLSLSLIVCDNCEDGRGVGVGGMTARGVGGSCPI